jgi:hypothetical protein
LPSSMNVEFDGEVGHWDRCRNGVSVVGWNRSLSRYSGSCRFTEHNINLES